MDLHAHGHVGSFVQGDLPYYAGPALVIRAVSCGRLSQACDGCFCTCTDVNAAQFYRRTSLTQSRFRLRFLAAAALALAASAVFSFFPAAAAAAASCAAALAVSAAPLLTAFAPPLAVSA